MPRYSAETLTITERGLHDYENDLGINIENLKGKKVLDVGSGYGTFQEQCNEIGIEAISLDPLYKHSEKVNEYFHEHLQIPENRRNKIAAINEALPFAKGSFDVVLSDCSSFYYLHHNYPKEATRRNMTKRMFKEVLRVLKSGGEARIGEVRNTSRIRDQEFYEATLAEIHKENNDFSWNFIKPLGLGYLILHKN